MVVIVAIQTHVIRQLLVIHTAHSRDFVRLASLSYWSRWENNCTFFWSGFSFMDKQTAWKWLDLLPGQALPRMEVWKL